MKETIRILHLEDKPADAELIARALKKDGLSVSIQVADDRDGFIQMLGEGEPELVISDYTLPTLNGMDAIGIVQEHSPRTPIIICTGSIDETTAVQCLKAGADDYVLKEHMARLGSAVKGALDHKRSREEKEFAEQALSEQHAYVRNLIDSSLDMIIAVDNRRNITEFNSAAEAAFGYDREEVLGKHVNLLYAEPEEGLALHKKTVLNGQHVQEITNRRKNGELFPALLSASVLRDYGGKIVGVVGVSRDITERRNLEAQLRQSQRMEAIGQLAGGVAHDFNNLLTIILFYAQELENSQRDKQVKADLVEIRKAGERAADLTRQLLAFSRKQVIEPVQLRVNEVIANMQKMLRRLVREDIVLETLLSENELIIQADPGQIEQILVNAVVNAQDAINELGDTDGERNIVISTDAAHIDDEFIKSHPGARAGDYCRLSISDTGVGMSEEVTSKVFEPFYTTKEVGKGTGLGLSTVYGIIKQNSGYIDIESTPGKGTTFQIFWPADTSAATQPEQEMASGEKEGEVTILFVEDDEKVRRVGTAILKSLGYEFIGASDGIDALEKIAQLKRPVDLLISDVVMPNMDGMALAKKLQSEYPNLKVLLTSGYPSDKIARQGVLDEDLAFISKPYDKDSMTKKIREVLGTS